MSTQPQIELSATHTRASFFRRTWIVLAVLVTLVLLALLPPYLNVNRFQRRITTTISASLGRPVHLDNVTLTLLPFPGFTLDNFVVSEDPAFGFEPTIRANTVTARIRVSTLWHRRIEISRISFTDPSVNIVHTADGKWNLDSILLQASRVSTAPTAQSTVGPAPRFPYIEATGARLNLKLGQVKTPFALTEADFALWLPSPETWNFRITARPARTDVPVGYSGLLHLEGTLGRAPTLTEIPIDLRGEWRAAPLGELSRIFLGRDADWRGEVNFTASTHGTVGSNELHTALSLTGLHRTGFVPFRPIALSADCSATLTNAFTSIPSLFCAAPAASSPPVFTLAASIPDLRNSAPSALHAILAPIPTAFLVPVLQTFSSRFPPQLTLGGTIGGALDCDMGPCDSLRTEASLDVANATILNSPDAAIPIVLGDLNFHTPSSAAVSVKLPLRRSLHSRPLPVAPPSPVSLLIHPTTLNLGAPTPAHLEGRIDIEDLTLQITGSAAPGRLAALSEAIPQIADALPKTSPAPLPSATPIHLDITIHHPWINSPKQPPSPLVQTPPARRKMRTKASPRSLPRSRTPRS